jgi:hypothetical protein
MTDIFLIEMGQDTSRSNISDCLLEFLQSVTKEGFKEFVMRHQNAEIFSNNWLRFIWKILKEFGFQPVDVEIPFSDFRGCRSHVRNNVSLNFDYYFFHIRFFIWKSFIKLLLKGFSFLDHQIFIFYDLFYCFFSQPKVIWYWWVTVVVKEWFLNEGLFVRV